MNLTKLTNLLETVEGDFRYFSLNLQYRRFFGVVVGDRVYELRVGREVTTDDNTIKFVVGTDGEVTIVEL